jgi:hypothetical protein
MNLKGEAATEQASGRVRPENPQNPAWVGKPRGVLHPRAQRVGPEQFGIVCFDRLWESPIPWHLLRHYPTAGQLHDAGLTTLCQSLRQAGIRFQQRTVAAAR